MDLDKSIRLSELRTLANGLFDILEEKGIDLIPVTQGSYWTVFFSEAFSSDSPPAPTMSDVWDDLMDLRSEVVNQTPDGIVTFWHAFEHLSGLMKFIAHADLERQLVPARSQGSMQ